METRKRVLVFAATVLSAIVLYAVSCGPCLYVLMMLDKKFPSSSSWMEDAYFAAYGPHMDLCYVNEPYFQYITWYQKAAGRPPGSYEDFRRFWGERRGYPSKAPERVTPPGPPQPLPPLRQEKPAK
jgi:hypothetical protein